MRRSDTDVFPVLYHAPENLSSPPSGGGSVQRRGDGTASGRLGALSLRKPVTIEKEAEACLIHASLSEVPWAGQRGWGWWQRFGAGDFLGRRMARSAVWRYGSPTLGSIRRQKPPAGVLLAANKKPDGTAQAVPSGEILLCQRKRSPLSGPDSGRKRPG